MDGEARGTPEKIDSRIRFLNPSSGGTGVLGCLLDSYPTVKKTNKIFLILAGVRVALLILGVGRAQSGDIRSHVFHWFFDNKG